MTFRDVEQLFSFLPELVSSRTVSRNRIREERVQQARELENKGQKEEARRVMAQSAQITFDVVKGLIKVRIKTFRNSVVELAM